jgi:hypothetical protein
MARLAKLTRNLLIVIPAVVTIALLLLLFQQGFGFFNLPAQLSERVPNSIRRSFSICARRCSISRSSFSIFSSARASANAGTTQSQQRD